MGDGKGDHMNSRHILQWSRNIGDVHLLCIHIFPPWGFNPWVTYPTGTCYFQPEWIPSGSMYREPLHGKRDRFNQEVRPGDAIFIQGNRSSVCKRDIRNYNGGRKLTWVPLKRARPKSIINSDSLDTAHALKPGEGQSAAGVENSTEAKNTDAAESGSVRKRERC